MLDRKYLNVQYASICKVTPHLYKRFAVQTLLRSMEFQLGISDSLRKVSWKSKNYSQVQVYQLRARTQGGGQKFYEIFSINPRLDRQRTT